MTLEKDSLGFKKVPKNAFYGAFTQRALENFHISGRQTSLNVIYSIVEIKLAAARAHLKLKELDSRKVRAIEFACQEILKGKYNDQFVLDAIQGGGMTPSHMNVNEVIAKIASRKARMEINAHDDVNFSQSSNDVAPSAIKLAALKQEVKLLEELKQLKLILDKKATEFRKIIKVGRTHLQDAVPISLGQEFHAHAVTISENIRDLQNSQHSLRELSLGGTAIGTGVNASSRFSKVIVAELNKLTKNQFKFVSSKEKIYETQSYHSFVESSNALRGLAIDLVKMCNDFILLSSGPRAGISEIILPAVEEGSSIMPGKVNPNIPEALRMACFQVIGESEIIDLASMHGALELNVNEPIVAEDLLDQIQLLMHGIKMFRELCVKGIKANKEQIQKHLEHSTVLATYLTPKLGYHPTAKLVQESLRRNKSITDLVLEKNLMTKKELLKLIK